MKKLKGRLQYMGWSNQPWNLMTEDGEINLWLIVEEFLVSINGKRANQDQKRDGYILRADEKSAFQFNYVSGECVLLKKPEGFGMSNVHHYLDTALIWLSGRMVEIEVENGKQIKFVADEEVHGVYFAGEGNSCEVLKGDEQVVCKIGQLDCCIFLTAGSNGFCCEKFNGPLARSLLDRLAKGTIRASRIGSCAILGRKKEKE